MIREIFWIVSIIAPVSKFIVYNDKMDPAVSTASKSKKQKHDPSYEFLAIINKGDLTKLAAHIKKHNMGVLLKATGDKGMN